MLGFFGWKDKGPSDSRSAPSFKYYGREPPKEFISKATAQCNATTSNKPTALMTAAGSTKVSMKKPQAMFGNERCHVDLNTFHSYG